MRKKSIFVTACLVSAVVCVGCTQMTRSQTGMDQREKNSSVTSIQPTTITTTIVVLTPVFVTPDVAQPTRTTSPVAEAIESPGQATPTSVNRINTLCSPLSKHPIEILPEIISDPYNPPPLGKDGRHMGVDFSYYHWQDRDTIAGVAIQALLPGKVVAVLDNSIPYGYAVMIETPVAIIPSDWLQGLDYQSSESLYLLYAHMEDMSDLLLGTDVNCGDILGIVGQTGGVDTPYSIPHLHLEARFGEPGAEFKEMGYYDTRISDAARQNYLLWRTSEKYRHFDPMILITNYLGNRGVP